MAATVYEGEICGGWLGSSQIECFLCLVTSITTDIVTINDPRNKVSSSRARSPSRHLAFRLLEMRFMSVWPPYNNKLGVADLTVRWKFETFLTNDFSFYW